MSNVQRSGSFLARLRMWLGILTNYSLADRSGGGMGKMKEVGKNTLKKKFLRHEPLEDRHLLAVDMTGGMSGALFPQEELAAPQVARSLVQEIDSALIPVDIAEQETIFTAQGNAENIIASDATPFEQTAFDCIANATTTVMADASTTSETTLAVFPQREEFRAFHTLQRVAPDIDENVLASLRRFNERKSHQAEHEHDVDAACCAALENFPQAREHGKISQLEFIDGPVALDDDGVMMAASSGDAPTISISVKDDTWIWERGVKSNGDVGHLVIEVSASGTDGDGASCPVVRLRVDPEAYGRDFVFNNINPYIPTSGCGDFETTGEFSIGLSGGHTFELKLTPVNNAIPENDKTVKVDLLPYVSPDESGGGEYECGNSSATVTIKDDDNWEVSAAIYAAIGSSRDYSKALEPCTWITGAERHGAYLISRKEVEGKNATDRTYSVKVEFAMTGTATPGNNGSTGDYHLTYNPNGGVASDMIGIGANNKGIITIPAGDDFVIVYVMPNPDSIFEPDETAILTITKAYASTSSPNNPDHWFDLGTTTATVTILQAPEFISDADPPPLPDPLLINGDTYHAYISSKAKANTPINVFTPVYAVNNRGVKYTFVKKVLNASGEEVEVLFLENDLFKINENTGVITTKVDLENVEGLQSIYNLKIRAYDPAPGLQKLYDEASVPIAITEWIVDRNNGARAPARSMMGCTIAELADEIGLDAGEYKKWLTFTTDTIQLANNTTIAASALTTSHILAPNQQFQIPNTIYMAWFGEGGILGSWWMSFGINQSNLTDLGFNVVTFNNDECTYASNAKYGFGTQIEALAENKALHGLYMMGHGSTNSIGSDGTKVYTVGPEWSIYYGVVDPNSSLGSDMDQWTIGQALNYHLGALVIHACYGADSNAKNDLVSSNGGIFYGFHGTYVPIPGFGDLDPIAKLWGYSEKEIVYSPYASEVIKTYGGKQRTKTFVISIMIGPT